MVDMFFPLHMAHKPVMFFQLWAPTNPARNIILFWNVDFWDLLWPAQNTMYCTSEGTLHLQDNEYTILGKNSKFDPPYGWKRNGWKRRPGNTVPNCLSFSNISQQIVRIVSLCFIMFHMLMGSVPPFPREPFQNYQNYFVHLYNHFRDTKPMRFQFHFRKLLRKKCMQNIQQMWAHCVILAHTHIYTNGLMLGHPHFIVFPWFIEILLPFSKNTSMSVLR